MRIGWATLITFLAVTWISAASRIVAEESAASAFEEASVVFEQNATDGDVEVVFTVKGGDEGLRQLTVVRPDGQTVVQISCPAPDALGLRQFVFESPEPQDDGELRAAFPEGTYIFRGESVSGEKFAGSANLVHALPDVVTLHNPPAEAEDVAVEGLIIEWTPVAGVTTYHVEIEQENTNISLNVSLPAGTRSFAVPAGFLVPGTEYQLGIGTEDANGNSSFIEISFETAD